MKIRKNILLLFLLLFANVLIFAGCGQEDENDSGLKFAYISKDLNHQWFQLVSSGISDICSENNVEYRAFDAAQDNKSCLRLVKQVIAEEYDALMICVSDQNLGPEVSSLCEEAGIPLIAIDDDIKREDGTAVPFVGMARREAGAIGGLALANMAEQRSFPLEGNRTHILEIDDENTSVYRERLDGYEDALLGNLPLTQEDVMTIYSTTGMYYENYTAVKNYFQEQDLNSEEYWIICGFNDDSAIAPMHALKELGVSGDHIIACGIGGYDLSLQEFRNQNSGYITVMTQPRMEGRKAARMLYEYFADGTEIEQNVITGGNIATSENYTLYYSGN